MFKRVVYAVFTDKTLHIHSVKIRMRYLNLNRYVLLAAANAWGPMD